MRIGIHITWDEQAVKPIKIGYRHIKMTVSVRCINLNQGHIQLRDVQPPLNSQTQFNFPAGPERRAV
jgi:hypothetical protein